MNLFTNDLFRSFAAGFALGGALLVAVMSAGTEKGISEQVIPSATAATAAPPLPDLTLIDPTLSPAH